MEYNFTTFNKLWKNIYMNVFLYNFVFWIISVYIHLYSDNEDVLLTLEIQNTYLSARDVVTPSIIMSIPLLWMTEKWVEPEWTWSPRKSTTLQWFWSLEVTATVVLILHVPEFWEQQTLLGKVVRHTTKSNCYIRLQLCQPISQCVYKEVRL